MIRYRLDDLGAYQFEKLVQSVLKVKSGLSVESWGNRGDFGRDAYTRNSLRYPNADTQHTGPFLFQVKFIEGANAAGAQPDALLLSSVSKEIVQIERRKASPSWNAPKWFTFITNSLIKAKIREKIHGLFLSAIPGAEIVIWNGDDICDVLDQAPTVSRSFPQLLSIRDLDHLIRCALSKESIERSSAAIDTAKELVPIFAPTANYERAWRVLRKHHFAVLGRIYI